jgi:hypothetical protein
VSRGIFWRNEQDLKRQICELLGPGLTPPEWHTYVRTPGMDYRPTCAG